MAERMGGPPRSTRGLGEAVAQSGHAISYWSAADEADMAELAPRGPETRPFDMVWPRAWFRSTALARQLAREIASIDLLHIHGVWSHPHYAAAKIGRQSDTPYLIAPRAELEPWRVRRNFAKYLKKRAYLAILGRPMLQGAACMHAVNPREADGFRQIGYKGPIAVVPNGIDADSFAELPHPRAAEEYWPVLKGRRVVLFLSRLKTEKGLDQLIPAWKRLLAAGSGFDDALLVIAGPDDRGYREVVEALVEQCGLRGRVLLPGMVRGHRKRALISRAAVYTLPSYSEGFSMAVLENLAAGKPVLITPGCHFPEVVQAGAGLCVPPETPALEEALRKLLDMPEADRAAMGRRGRELVRENYTWDTAARKMITVYRCIMEGKEIPLHPQPAKTSGEQLPRLAAAGTAA